MKQRFRLYRRKRGGKFYVHDGLTGKQESLGTSDRTEVQRLLHTRNEAERQPAMNLQIARAYLVASDPQIATRTWQFVMDEAGKLKNGPTRQRWGRAMKDKAFDFVRQFPILETRAEHFLQYGTLSKIENFEPYRPSAAAMRTAQRRHVDLPETLTRGGTHRELDLLPRFSGIMLETLPFKFSGAMESVYIFSNGHGAVDALGAGLLGISRRDLLINAAPSLGWRYSGDRRDGRGHP